jgi:PAS domain S-box-containing protein
MRQRAGYTNTTAEVARPNSHSSHKKTNLVLLTARTKFSTVRLDRRGRYLTVNEAFEREAGETRERLIGQCVWDLYPWLADSEKGRWIRQRLRSGRQGAATFDSVVRPGYRVLITMAPVPGAMEVVWSYIESAQASRPSAKRFG